MVQIIKSGVQRTVSIAALAAALDSPRSSIMQTAAQSATTTKESDMRTAIHTADAGPIPAQFRRTETPDQRKERLAKLDAKVAAPERKLLSPSEAAKVAKATEAPKVAKPKKPGKKTKAGFERGTRGESGPTGAVAECLKLAGRKQGADRDELSALTKWKGTPWKWMFFNSKGNGWCQRHGYDLRVFTGADGETRYAVSKTEGKPKVAVEAAAPKPVAKAAPAKARTGKAASKAKPRSRKAKGRKKTA